MSLHPVDPPAGNAKHAAARVARAEQLVQLRSEITESLAVLADLARKLEHLADSRQRLRTRIVTAETQAILKKQTERDRAAARGILGRNPDRTLAWLYAGASIGSGQVATPVQTLPAVSVVAEIRYALRHNIRRLGRPAKLTALEHEQTADEDYGYCPWPRHPILTATLDIDDQGIDRLAVRLARLVGVYTNRKELAALKRDLERLEEAAKDITHGTPGKSAMLIGSETCPHCTRNTLAVLSRVPGISALVIRCEGHHRCVCDDDMCACHRVPSRHRHEWINSGHATHTFHDLKRAQNRLKERHMLETKATDAIAVIRHLHDAVRYQPWSHECTNPAHEPEGQWLEPENGAGQPGDLVCIACPPIAVVCTTCRENDGSEVAWPCPTALACDIDGEIAALIATSATDPE